MFQALTALMVAASLGATHDQLAEKIVTNGHRRVVICPRAFPDKVDEVSFGTPLGGQSLLLPEQLSEELAGIANGRFELISSRVANSVFKDLTYEDLGDLDALKGLGRKTGADGLVLLTVRDLDKSRIEISAELIDLRDASDDGIAKETVVQTISDAAYRGRSFELRRWEGDRLVAVGFQDRLTQENRNREFGVGPGYEELQLAALRDDLAHPYATGGLPYGFEVLVNGEARQPEAIYGQYFVELNPGETYSLRLYNEEKKSVFMGLYVDGVNTINQVMEAPQEAPTKRHWSLKPGYAGKVNGWFQINEFGDAEFEEFVIVDTSNSKAVQVNGGLTEQLGMITAIIYTDGMDIGAQYPTVDEQSRNGGGAFATGGGARKLAQLAFNKGNRGLMLAAVTVHYRTAEELVALRKEAERLAMNETPMNPGTTEAPLAKPPAGVDEPVNPIRTVDPVRTPSAKPAVAGEDELFPGTKPGAAPKGEAGDYDEEAVPTSRPAVKPAAPAKPGTPAE